MAEQTIVVGGDMGRPTWRVCIYLCLFFLLIGVGSGYGIGHWWETSDLKAKLAAAEAKPPVIKEVVKTVTDTKLQYVKGETVYLPVPGQPNAPPVATKLDGKFSFNKPEFVYMVNGKPGKFTKTDDEQFIFEKNMLQLTQSSVIRIEAELPTIDKTKYYGIGIGAGLREGKVIEAILLEGPVNKSNHVGWWLYGDGSFINKSPTMETLTAGMKFKF